MINYQIDFECHWNESYPVSLTCGTFNLQKENELEVIYEIKRRFL